MSMFPCDPQDLARTQRPAGPLWRGQHGSESNNGSVAHGHLTGALSLCSVSRWPGSLCLEPRRR